MENQLAIYNRAFDAFNDICDDITSNFCFTQHNDTITLTIEGKNRQRVATDAALFMVVYFDNDARLITLPIMRTVNELGVVYVVEIVLMG